MDRWNNTPTLAPKKILEENATVFQIPADALNHDPLFYPQKQSLHQPIRTTLKKDRGSQFIVSMLLGLHVFFINAIKNTCGANQLPTNL